MILGGKPRTVVRCDRPHDHRAHAPYVRPEVEEDLACPGGPRTPVDELLLDLAVSAA